MAAYIADNKSKLRRIFTLAAITLVLSFGLDWLGITLIIKRIASTSFTKYTQWLLQ
jgi:hypothetical protein